MTAAERSVERLVRYWRDILGIHQHWTIGIKVFETRADTPKKKRKLSAWIVNESAYRRSYLYVNTWNCNDDLESTIVHELIHVVMDRVDVVVRETLGRKYPKTYNEMLESVVDQLEAAFRAVRKSR